MQSPYTPTEHLVVLPSELPAPGHRVLPVSSFLVRGRAPVLIDTGMARESALFLEMLDCLVDPAALEAIVITHEDADHAGALARLLDRAPRAQLVMTPTTAGKLSAALDLPFERVRLVGPGQHLTLGGRRYEVVSPPLYDSPGTIMLFEEDARWLFASDAFAAFVPQATEHVDELHADDVLWGMTTFGRANSPWVGELEPEAWRRRVQATARLHPQWVLSAHLPPVPAERLPWLWQQSETLPWHEAGDAPMAATAG